MVRRAELDKFTFTITEELEGERIDKCLSMLIDSLSRSFIQKLIKDEEVFVNGKAVKANYKVKTIVSKNKNLGSIKVLKGKKEQIPITLQEDATIIEDSEKNTKYNN